MNRILALLLALIAFPAFGQVTTAKPGAPSLDTAETHFPDHLWLMNEGTGTTLEDDGDHTDHDLTFVATTGAGPDWIVDGTHGDALDFVAANDDYAVNTGVSSLTGTQTACAIVTLVAGTGSRHIMSWNDPSQSDRKARLVYQGDEDIESQNEFDGALITNTSTQDGTGGWDLVCVRWSDTISDWSLNGSAWDTTYSVSGPVTGLLAAITNVALGADADFGPGGFFNDSMTAAWWWHGSKSDAEISAIYNSGNPWGVIGVDASAAPLFTAGPTIGTVTTTTIPMTATSDTTGTWEAVACPDGQAAPTVAQVLAGNCTGDVAAAATFAQAVVATVGDSDTLTGLSAGTIYDVHSAIDAAIDSNLATNANVTTNSRPAFTAGPAAGAITSTTIPITFTVDQTGTVYGVACPDGQAAPTVVQVKAGNCTGDIAAVDAFSQAVVAAVADGDTFTPLVASTTYDTHYVPNSTVNGDAAAITTLANQTTSAGGAPGFTSGPTETPATDGFTIAGTITCTGTCTVEAVACNPGDTAPTANEIEAGQCGGGNTALMNASEVWVTTVANDFLLTSANKQPRFDVYVSGTDGTTDTSVVPFLEQDRTIRSGFAVHALTSVATTSIFDLDTYFEADVSAGDIIEFEDDTNEDADCNVSFEADGDLVLTPVGAGNCDGKRTFNISYQDISSDTTGLFTAPAVGNFTTDDLVCANNTAPAAGDEYEVPVAWAEDEVITAIDLSSYFTDANGDALTFTLTSGSWPTGISQSGTGNKDVTGTPTTENESGITLVVTATDECGDSATYSFYDGVDFYVINTWAVPDLDDLTPSEAENAVIVAAPWRLADPGVVITGYDCGTGQSFLNVATQDPVFGGEVGPYEEINIELVGAFLPDLVGMTEAQAIAAIEAVCP